MKKFLATILVLVLTASLFAGCGNTDDSNGGTESVSTKDAKDTADTNETSGENDTASSGDFSEKVTIDINVIDTDKQNNDARYEFLAEKFNVEFELVATSLNDVKEKARMWVAAGDMPSVMWSEINGAGELKTWAQSGVLKEIPDLSDYPNLKAIQDDIQTDDTVMVDGKRYFINTARDLASVDYLGTQLFIYRKDWAEALGMYQEEYTWEEMMNLAKAMVAQDPGENGDGKTIGMTSVKWAYPKCIGLVQSVPYWDSFHNKDGEYIWGPEQPETIEAIVLAKRMADEGVIWNEQALAQNADGPAKFAAGQVGILYHNLHSGNISKIVAGLKEVYPGEDVMDKIEIMKVIAPGGNGYYAEEVPDTWGQICISAKASDEVTHRMLAIMDFLATEEGVRLQRYGLEGIDYQMNGDEIELLWDKDEAGNYINPYPTNSDRLLSLVMLNEFEKGVTDLVNAEVQAVNKQIIAYLQSDDKVIREKDYAYSAFSAPNKDTSTLGGDTKNKVIELLMTSNDIEADYKAWLETQQEKKQAVLDELIELTN